MSTQTGGLNTLASSNTQATIFYIFSPHFNPLCYNHYPPNLEYYKIQMRKNLRRLVTGSATPLRKPFVAIPIELASPVLRNEDLDTKSLSTDVTEFRDGLLCIRSKFEVSTHSYSQNHRIGLSGAGHYLVRQSV